MLHKENLYTRSDFFSTIQPFNLYYLESNNEKHNLVGTNLADFNENLTQFLANMFGLDF